MDWKLLGMDVEPDDDLAQPLEAAAVIKGLDQDGNIAYYTVKTEGLQNVEVLGMMTWGADVALNPGEDDE